MILPAWQKVRKILILSTCQNTGFYHCWFGTDSKTKNLWLISSFFNKSFYCTFLKMADAKWKLEKDRILKMTLDERRKNYKTTDIMSVDTIDPWCTYVIRNKDIEKKKHTLEDLTEFRKIKIDNSMNKLLQQKVSIFKGDITKLEVSAIVNAANSMLRAGGGVDGAIHRAAGPLLQEECNTLGGCPTGEARITGGYNLPAKYVIHTVGPQDGSPTKLQSCYENSLAFHKEKRLNSIAFPCISTGIYGFPNRLAAHIALRTARKFLEKNAELDRIIFCTFMPIDIDIYETLMQMYFPLHDWNYNDGASITDIYYVIRSKLPALVWSKTQKMKEEKMPQASSSISSCSNSNNI